jgi:hypothetical protein
MTTHPLTEAGITRFSKDWTADPGRARWLHDLGAERAAA